MRARFATPPMTGARHDSSAVWGRYQNPDGTPAFPFPMLLQERASVSARFRIGRTALRLACLLLCDGMVLGFASLTLRALRNAAASGELVSGIATSLAPEGAVPWLQAFVAIILGLMFFGAYARDRWDQTRNVFKGVAFGLTIAFWQHLWETAGLGPIVVLLIAIVAIGGLTRLERMLVKQVSLGRIGRAAMATERAVVIGSANFGRMVADHPRLRSRSSGFRIVGFLDVSPYPAVDALGGVPDLVRAIAKERIDAVILSDNVDQDLFTDVLAVADAAGAEVFVVGAIHTAGTFAPIAVMRGAVPMVQYTRPVLRAHQLVLKRVVDFALSATALVALSPLFAVLALLVKVTSPGPAFFSQLRIGHRGRGFRIFKFRSMLVNTEASRKQLESQSAYGDARLFKVKNDPRLTPIGSFIRRTSLDELPQLLNVLIGDMALVGPRPPLPSEVELYDEDHFTRFDMKPGITGPWQVAGRNDIREFDQVVALETAYLRNWTIWKDLDILARTVPVVLTGKGAC